MLGAALVTKGAITGTILKNGCKNESLWKQSRSDNRLITIAMTYPKNKIIVVINYNVYYISDLVDWGWIVCVLNAHVTSKL